MPLYIVWFVSVLMGDLAILKILLTGEKHVLEGKPVQKTALSLHKTPQFLTEDVTIATKFHLT